MLVFSLAYSSALKMEVTCPSETSVDFHRATQRYIIEDRTRHSTAVRTLNPTQITEKLI
jgi:hypothetical protein